MIKQPYFHKRHISSCKGLYECWIC